MHTLCHAVTNCASTTPLFLDSRATSQRFLVYSCIVTASDKLLYIKPYTKSYVVPSPSLFLSTTIYTLVCMLGTIHYHTTRAYEKEYKE